MVSAHCVKMGDNATDVAGGVEGGKGGGGRGGGESHILMPACKYLHSLLSHNVLYSFSFEERYNVV